MSLFNLRNQIENEIATALVDAALAAGYTLSVHDGVEVALAKSSDRPAILGAMASTDEDTLILWRNNQRIGGIWLIYGNGSELISDHTDNADVEALVAQVLARFDT